MAGRFTASPPGDQHPDTVRQFQELEQLMDDIENTLRFLVSDFIIPNYTFAAHGTMFSVAPEIGPDIPAAPAWTTVQHWSQTDAVNRITFDPVGNSWTYTTSGVYVVALELIISHGELNAGRQIQVRLNDGTDPGGVPVSIARNQPGTNIGLTFMQNIPILETNRTFTVEVGNGDALTGVTWEASSVTIFNVGAWIDDIPTPGAGRGTVLIDRKRGGF